MENRQFPLYARRKNWFEKARDRALDLLEAQIRWWRLMCEGRDR